MSATMLPPKPETPSEIPPLVESDDGPMFSQVLETARDTWRPARFESDAPEYA